MSVTNEYQLADRRIKEWFLREKARREGHTHGRHLPIAITISRQFGAGGHTVAEALARKLGEPWQTWDRSIIDRVADSAHVQHEMVEAIDEHARTWVEDVIRFAMGLGILEQATFRKHLALVLAALAQQGHIITIGRGANFVLPSALNIRLMADLEARAQTVMRLEQCSHAEALKKIHQVDKERADYTRKTFDRDIDDPCAYSMMLCTSDLGLPAVVEGIAAVARERFGREVSHSLR